MDSKLYRELSEAYLNVYAPKEILESKDEEDDEEEEENTKKKSSKKDEDDEDEDEMEEMDEAVENLDEISANLALTASQKADEQRRKAAVSGDKETAAKKAAQASRLYKGVGPRRTRERMGGMKEEVDVYDEVIEFLCVEGYAETLEEAEWMMANIIDEEAIDIILGEADSLAAMQARREKRQKANMKKHGTPGFDYSKPPSGKKGYLDAITKKEEFELWVNALVEEGYDLSDYTWDDMYEFYLDEAEGSYGQTPKARAAMGKVAIARREKPASEYSQKGEKTKKVKSIEKHTQRIDNGPDAGNRGKKSTSPRWSGYKGATGRGKMSQDTRDYARDRDVEYSGGENKPGSGTVTKNPKKLRKQKAMGEIAKEAFEAWLDEAMTNYEKNRKRAAQRAAARNAARDQGKTGAVPGVGYVTPRRERETWTDEKGKTRHAKGL